MTELVSVVIPSYNRANVLSRCIDSALNQSYSNIEIIVVDDGSTDNTSDILSQYKDKINVIYQENLGVSKARNIAVKKSTGKYIAFLDSDDEWFEDKIAIQMKYFDLNENIALMSCNFILTAPDGNVTQLIPDKNSLVTTLEFDDVFKYPYFGLPNVIILKEVFNLMKGFDESLKTAEDLDLFLRVSINYKIRIVNKVLTRIYVSPDSISADTSSYIDNIYVLKNLIRNNRDMFVGKEKLINNVMVNLYLEYSRSLIWHKKYVEATKIILKSVRYKLKIETLILLFKSLLYRLL